MISLTSARSIARLCFEEGVRLFFSSHRVAFQLDSNHIGVETIYECLTFKHKVIILHTIDQERAAEDIEHRSAFSQANKMLHNF